MRVIDLRLTARPDSVPHARQAMDGLTGLASQTTLEDARLLVSELVTNSIRHGDLSTGDDISLQADVDGGTLHVEVEDPGVGFEMRPWIGERVDRDSGWGLYLVGRLADRWGVSADGSTLVWFDIPLRRGDDPPP